jgi:hypothetical protein
LHFIIEWLFCCESVDGFKDPYAASIGLATHHPKRLQDKLPPIPAMNFYGGKNSDSSRCFNRIPSNKKKAGLKGFMFNQVELTSPFLFFLWIAPALIFLEKVRNNERVRFKKE